MKNKGGFGLIEIIVAVAMFVILFGAGGMNVVGSFKLNRFGVENTKADFLAREGIEAVRSIKKRSFDSLVNGNYALDRSSGNWELATGIENIDGYSREIRIEDGLRDGSGNISSSGTADSNLKKISSRVWWNFGINRNLDVGYTAYLSNWEKSIQSKKRGMLAYGDGGTSNDSIKYRIIDEEGNWSAVATAADVDTGSTNKAARLLKIYNSPINNNKIILSKHFNGSTQFIYGQVYNGTNFGNVNLIGQINGTNYLGNEIMDGTFLENGDFMVVYSDNSTTPKFKIWNGTSWSGSMSTQNIKGVPESIVVRARPGTNEVMAVIFDQGLDTNSLYFNGGSYTQANWTWHKEHASGSPADLKKMVDFDWSSSNSNIGTMIFSNTPSDSSLTFRVFTADNTGDGSWSVAGNSSNQAGRLGGMSVVAAGNLGNFLGCDKDNSSAIYCYESDLSGSIGSPFILGNSTIEDNMSFGIGFESASSEGLVVYSDNSTTAKYRTYDATTNSFSGELSYGTAVSARVRSVVVKSAPGNDDIMVVTGDDNNDIYTRVWDGANNGFYSSGGYAFQAQGVNGSSGGESWYDFEWEN